MKTQTRHLEATSEIQHGDLFFRPGDHFQASEVDADYYLRSGKAKDASSRGATPAEATAAKTPAAAKQADVKPAAAKPAAPTPRAVAPARPAVAPAAAPVSAPAPAAAAPLKSWERTEPMKLADVPHPDVDVTPPKG